MAKVERKGTCSREWKRVYLPAPEAEEWTDGGWWWWGGTRCVMKRHNGSAYGRGANMARELPYWEHVTGAKSQKLFSFVLVQLQRYDRSRSLKNRRKVYERPLRDLLNRERERAGQTTSRSSSRASTTALRSPPHLVPARPTLVRYPDPLLSLENIVVIRGTLSGISQHKERGRGCGGRWCGRWWSGRGWRGGD
ncbi:hypothetical protein DFH07DRAFT_947060 [Mycena maculata]|uniref:Uncharacterized protein n=1 Tax=Mycena maculata TaxID=230809 RepID=A0AAD7HGA3_9AGAR|nr:hypothetical protein DFH07DRAFT_947060 [Mycena maculata]